MAWQYDAVLLVSFGGPEGPDDVMPFLRNVVRGRDVPDARLAEVAEHYQHFGGVSPINAHARALLEALRVDLDKAGIALPLYWGNRNWRPYLTDAVAAMRDDGVRRALAFVTSPFGSYSSCRQYLDDIASARAAVGPDAPAVDKIRHYHDHPGYVAPHADAVRAELAHLSDVEPEATRLVFTAHSLPSVMDAQSGPDGGRYSAQMRETAALVADAAYPGQRWDLAWQSRSGPPQVPWLDAGHQRAPRILGRRRASVPWWSARSGSSPTTWKSSGTSTSRRRRRPAGRGCGSPAPRRRAPTRGSSG